MNLKEKMLNNIFKFNLKILKKPLLKRDLKGLTKKNGKNNFGKITVKHKGGGNKKKYRKINLNKAFIFLGIVCSIEYDPIRNSNIASVYNILSKIFFYITAPKNLKVGQILKSNNYFSLKLGNFLALSYIPVGTYIYNIKLNHYSKLPQFSRSAGTFAQIKEKKLNYSLIKLASGKVKQIYNKNYASIGIVSNEFFFLSQLNKAGKSRWLNIRPTVRGVAMNPVDHPNGGGEGKKSGYNKNPWGKYN